MAYNSYEGGASYRGGGAEYGVPSAPTGQTAPLFEDTSSGPSFPPIGTAQQFLSNPMVTEAALQYGQGLVNMGQSYLDKGVNRFAPGIKQYFSVDTNYVLNKLWIVLFPYTHRDWSLQYSGNDPVDPRRDINAPDLYIPAMTFVTYVLLNGFVLGTQKRFTPEVLGISASSLLAWLVVEVLLIWLSMFLCRVTARLTWMDILAYCSYKYVSMIFSVGVSLLGGTTAYYIALAWSTAAIAYFEVQTLRLRVQPDITEGSSRIRNYLLLVIAIIQPLLILWLTWSLVKYQPPPTLDAWKGF